VSYGDRNNDSATNITTANLAQLKRIFEELSAMERKPELFFFLGDLVEGEKFDVTLERQLPAWFAQYNDPGFSPISQSGIELVAVPGNHEMLYYDSVGENAGDEFPLAGATDIWMEYALPYMPADRQAVGGPDSLDNRATFAFQRKNIGFVVMNTDTYNAPTEEHPKGLEGQAPVEWINAQITAYRENPEIDHVFVLGHKPYIVEGKPDTTHKGFADGGPIWETMQAQRAIAMLSAHEHNYNREQPDSTGGSYQVIAGNAGSKLTCSSSPACTYFGYSLIYVYESGNVELKSYGWDSPSPYYAVSTAPTTLRDSTELTWTPNANPFIP